MQSPNWLLYDGECPFCSSYVSYVRLRESVGPVTLADARKYPLLVAEAKARGYDIDEGMVLKLDGHYYFGGDCIHALSLLTTRSGCVQSNQSRAVQIESGRPLRISSAAYPAGISRLVFLDAAASAQRQVSPLASQRTGDLRARIILGSFRGFLRPRKFFSAGERSDRSSRS